MSVMIAHASSDENKKYKNGKAGDQTGIEVCIRSWYSRPWSHVIRFKDKSMREKVAQAMEDICKNNKIGYDQNQRNTLYKYAKANGFNFKSITQECETDCSAAISVACIYAGVKENVLYVGGNLSTTANLRARLVLTGLVDVYTASTYVKETKKLLRGDILLYEGHHVACVVSTDSNTSTTPSTPTVFKPITLSYPCKGVDVSGYQTNVSYPTLRQSGINFAILKIIRKDLTKDKLFEEHYKGFTDVGVPVVAVYNYSYATTTMKASSDAQKVLEYLGGRKIPVCLDVEDVVQQRLSIRLIDIINTYGDVITSANLPFIVYTGLSFFNSYIKPFINNLRYKNFWIARYYLGDKTMSFTDNPNSSYIPHLSGANLIGWQYTASGKVSGYNGDLDLDVLYSPINSVLSTTKRMGKLKPGVGGLNYRSSDSTAGKILGTYGPNDVLTIIGRSEKTGWYQTPDGWISDKYVVLV